MIERMHTVSAHLTSAEDRAQFWVGMALAVATAILLFASLLDVAMI